MYKIICKNLGFDCDFITTNNDKKIIVTNFEKHLQVDHKQHFQKKEIVALIDNQNNKQKNSEQTRNNDFTCSEDFCESFRLEKWHIGHRNFP
jgi:predicted small metal-binding protein